MNRQTRLMNCGVCNHAWEIPAEQPDAPVSCPKCDAHICACGCGKHLGEMRADSRYFTPACRTALEREGWASTRAARAHIAQTGATVHPLADARAEQEATAVNRQYGLLIRQAIIDRLKTTGTCHADDLEPLYPANELDRRRCRKLAGAQFGSLAASRGGREPLIREKERRKSSVPERKGAKSGVFEFTKAGWDKYGRARASADLPEPKGKGRLEEQDEEVSACSGEAGLPGPGGGAGVALSPGRRGRPDSSSTAPPEQTPTGAGGEGSASSDVAVAGLGHSSCSGGNSATVSPGRGHDQGGEAHAPSPASVADGSSEVPTGSSASEEPPPRLPGFEESAAARHMKDAA